MLARNSTVPYISHASPEARTKFRKGLGIKARSHFDKLVVALKNQSHDLVWYHDFGRRIRAFRNSQGDTDRSGVINALSSALGPSSSLLRKVCHFVRLYPDSKALKEVSNTGIDWMRLIITFAIPNKTKRHTVLRQAVRENWSQDDLRFQVQAKFPSRRRGVGGRPRRPVTRGFDAEGALREFHRLIGQLIALHDEALADMTEKDWSRLPPMGDPELLIRVKYLAKSLRSDLKFAKSAIAAVNEAVDGIISRADRLT
jgi:hypothetical protein